MNHYHIKYSDQTGTHETIKSTQFDFEDAEDWAEYKTHTENQKEHRAGKEQTPQPIQVWEFKEVTGVAAKVLTFLKDR